MNRLKDYFNFVIWFAGLGYVAIWPLAAPDALSACRANAAPVSGWLCRVGHVFALPPALHGIGFIASVFVTVRLLLIGLRRVKRLRAPRVTPSPPVVPGSRLPRRLFPTVKPRAHFGLRGTPR